MQRLYSTVQIKTFEYTLGCTGPARSITVAKLCRATFTTRFHHLHNHFLRLEADLVDDVEQAVCVKKFLEMP